MSHLIENAYLELRQLGIDSDALHTAVVEVIPRLGQVRDVKAYLKSVALRNCRKKSKRSAYPSPEFVAPVMKIESEMEEEMLAVRRAVANLPHRERLVVLQHYFHGRKSCETAIDLGLTPCAVRGLIFRALKRLKRLLSNMDSED